jgi:DNA polymerase I-like protein with 3'-5' exonuclease and polymerase domains
MIVGDGPTVTDASMQRPFAGTSGALLEALLASAGIQRDEVWFTLATLGLPPRDKGKAKSLMERAPNAVYSCLPRLEREIEAARPRVIVTLGQAALAALTGFEVEHRKQTAFACDNPRCDAERKVGPAIVCSTGECGWFQLASEGLDEAQVSAWADEVRATYPACPKCSAATKRLRPRRMKCPSCKGRKERVETFVRFEHEHGLVGREGAAGAVFEADQLPGRFDAFGVKYVIPTYDIGHCLRVAKDGDRRIGGQYAAHAAMFHLRKARELLHRDARFDYSVKTTSSPSEVRAWLAEPGRYAVDIETDSEEGPWRVKKITCVGFARVDRTEALVVDTRRLGHWESLTPGSEDARLLDALHEFLDDPERTKVFHNGTYDRVVIARLWGIHVEGVVGDTMLAHNACFPDEEHNLAFVAHELLDAPMWKDSRTSIKAGTSHSLSGYATFDQLADYNAKDDRITALLDEKFNGADGQHGLLAVEGTRAAYELDVKLAGIAVEMELAGLYVSTEALGKVEHDLQVLAEAELEAMRQIVGRDDFVPRGGDLQWALFDPMGPLGLVPAESTKTGQGSTSKDYLLKMRHEPFVDHLLRWREHDYYLSHYVRSPKLFRDEESRVHPQWKVIGARTGRWSSEPNFQNWPKSMRSIVTAPRGRKIVGADYSQLEMRIMASLSGDPELIRRCAEADESDKLNPECDPHAYVASLAFGKTYRDAFAAKDKKTCDRLRNVAKRVVYGLNYGAGAATVLAAIYDGGYQGPPLSVQLIERVTQTYFAAFPGVPKWREAQLAFAQAERKVQSPILGRHRIFPLGEVDATVAWNYPIQSGAADIMGTSLLVLRRELPHADPSAFLIAQVHDAVYVECDEARASEVARVVEESLSVDLALVPGAPTMPYVASASVADNWKDAA